MLHNLSLSQQSIATRRSWCCELEGLRGQCKYSEIQSLQNAITLFQPHIEEITRASPNSRTGRLDSISWHKKWQAWICKDRAVCKLSTTLEERAKWEGKRRQDSTLEPGVLMWGFTDNSLWIPKRCQVQHSSQVCEGLVMKEGGASVLPTPVKLPWYSVVNRIWIKRYWSSLQGQAVCISSLLEMPTIGIHLSGCRGRPSKEIPGEMISSFLNSTVKLPASHCKHPLAIHVNELAQKWSPKAYLDNATWPHVTQRQVLSKLWICEQRNWLLLSKPTLGCGSY